MEKEGVEHFFLELSREWEKPTQVYLLGGAAALILGGVRPTFDVDFEAKLPAGSSWDNFEKAVRAASAKTSIGVQCAESIERWGQLTLLDYHRHAKRWKSFKTIAVWTLEPEYWSIGKMSRYWDQDIQDMLAVFKRQRTDPIRLARTWARSIAASPKSTQLAPARRQALHFFQTFGKRIWGDSFPLESVQKLFQPSSPVRPVRSFRGFLKGMPTSDVREKKDRL